MSTTTDRMGPGSRLQPQTSTPWRQSAVGTVAGVVAIVGLWAWFAHRQPELVFPSPAETAHAISDLAREGTLFSATFTTILRAAAAVAIAVLVGVVWGALNGVSRWASTLSRAALATLMALPPILLVVMGITWMGPGAGTTRLVIVLVALPLIVVAVSEAVRNVDGDLLEMAAAFRLSRMTALRHVVAPAIASPVLAATSVAFAQSLRVAAMAELLSATDGIGAEVARARANVETADLFAWAVVLIAVVLVLEVAVLRPLTHRLLRWRDPR